MSMSEIAHADWRFETLSDAAAVLGESPQWSLRDGCVWWVDVTGRKLLRSDTASGHTRVWRTPEEIGFVVLTHGGAIVTGMESGLFRFDPVDGGFTLIWRLEGSSTRFNDAATDAAGRLWAATCDVDNKKPLGKLLCIEADLAVREVASGLLTPNGLAVDSGRGLLYLSDSHPTVQALWRLPLDLASGGTGAWQELARIADLKGRPDGGVIDAAGTYWIAGVGGGVLHGFSPQGRRVAEVATPMPDPTKIAFGGPLLDQVFLTSKMGKTGGGGCLAVGTPGISGQRETPFSYGPA